MIRFGHCGCGNVIVPYQNALRLLDGVPNGGKWESRVIRTPTMIHGQTIKAKARFAFAPESGKQFFFASGLVRLNLVTNYYHASGGLSANYTREHTGFSFPARRQVSSIDLGVLDYDIYYLLNTDVFGIAGEGQLWGVGAVVAAASEHALVPTDGRPYLTRPFLGGIESWIPAVSSDLIRLEFGGREYLSTQAMGIDLTLRSACNDDDAAYDLLAHVSSSAGAAEPFSMFPVDLSPSSGLNISDINTDMFALISYD